MLAQATIQTIERYYLAIALLLRAGRSALTPEALEQRCVVDGAAHVHALRTRGAGILRSRHVPRLHRPAAAARRRSVSTASGRLDYDDALLTVAEDARVVLSEQIRNSILQVTHS